MIFNDSKLNRHWPVYPLAELGNFKRGKSRHRPRNDGRLFENGKYPLVQTGEIKEANLIISKHSAEYSEFGLAQSELWPEGTLCITIAANIAETAILGYPMCFPDSVVGFIADKKVSSEIYMHYVFSFIRRAIQNSASGSIQDNINVDYLTGLRLRIPPKATQDKIAGLLSALDAKIALNHRINSELEGMAKLLYDYWFVQYDFPLSAAQAAALGKPHLTGKPYRTSGGPMVYHNQLKREIPNGWTSGTLGELFNLYQPQTITEKDLKPDGDYFVYGANGIVGKYDRFNHEDPQIALTCRGSTCGNLTRTLPRSWITGNAMVMAPRDPNLDIEYIYNVANASGIDAIITGSGQPQITQQIFRG